MSGVIWLIVAIAVVVAVWFWRRRRAEAMPVALVMLLETPRLLTMDHVRGALESAGLKLSSGTIEEERISYFRLHVEGYQLTVASAPFKYFGEGNEGGREARMSQVIEAHNGCLLIDVWQAPEGKQLVDALPMMGRIMAELVDDSSLAIYSTTSQRLNLIDDELLQMLRNGETPSAMEQMTYNAVVQVGSDDPRMVAAVSEARSRWPEFVAAWQGASDRSMYIAKFPFGEGERVEYMWITPTAIEGDQVTGTLMNSPMRIPKLREGDVVTSSVEELNDWVFVTDDGPVGMFTEKIVRGG